MTLLTRNMTIDELAERIKFQLTRNRYKEIYFLEWADYCLKDGVISKSDHSMLCDKIFDEADYNYVRCYLNVAEVDGGHIDDILDKEMLEIRKDYLAEKEQNGATP